MNNQNKEPEQKPKPFIGARVVQMIETNLTVVGKGTEEEPYRRVLQYWSLDGNLRITVDADKDRKIPSLREVKDAMQRKQGEKAGPGT